MVKDAKEQLRSLPDGLTYGLLRYLNTDVQLSASDPPIGFNYLGRLGGTAAEGVDTWQICRWGSLLTDTVGGGTNIPKSGVGPQSMRASLLFTAPYTRTFECRIRPTTSDNSFSRLSRYSAARSWCLVTILLHAQ